MEQLYPIAGTTRTSQASQDYDFLNYWVDQTVEKEILRGKKLQELKNRQSIRKEKYDVINIGSSNSKKKGSKRRKISPTKSTKKGRNGSPSRKNSPTKRKVSKKSSKLSRQRCPLRIAELAVPSKRQCFDTWRNKYHILPGFMIHRLQQHVLDLSPVVKLTDAIECFRVHKYSKKRKKKCVKPKESKRKNIFEKYDDHDQKINKTSKSKQCQYLCAIFGHKIAKQLIKPATISLNTELANISNVVSIEIDNLINNGKRCSKGYIKNKKMHAEVAGKVSIWIANILDETANKILEDQLRDLEEEIGPVLDFMDDLVDNVVDICEPEPEVVEVLSSSDTYNVESSVQSETEECKYEEDISQINELCEEEEEKKEKSASVDEDLQFDVNDFPTEEDLIVDNLDDFIKKELDDIINCFDRDIPRDTEDMVFEDVVDSEPEQNEIFILEDSIKHSFDEYKPADTEDTALEDLPEKNKISILEDSIKHSFDEFKPTDTEDTALEDLVDSQLEQTKTPEIVDALDREKNEFVDAKDSFEFDVDGPARNIITEISDDSPETAEKKTMIIDQKQEKDKNAVPENDDAMIDILSEDDSNKKVTFSKVNIVSENELTGQGVISKKSSEFINPDQVFSPPKGSLLSDADESWPEDTSIHLKPSESVSKSITSLGNILEAEEKISVALDDKAQKIVDITATDSKQPSVSNEMAAKVTIDSKSIDITSETKTQDEINKSINAAIVDTQDKVDVFKPNKDSDAEDKTDIKKPDETLNDKTVDTKGLSENNEKVIKGSMNKEVNDIEKAQYDESDAKDPHKIQNVLDNISNEVYDRPSTDSTFDHHVPTDTVAFDKKIDNILEGDATTESDKVNENLYNEITDGANKLDQILGDQFTQATTPLDTMLESETVQGETKLGTHGSSDIISKLEVIEGSALDKKLESGAIEESAKLENSTEGETILAANLDKILEGTTDETTQEKADDETILGREATKETAELDNIRLETTDETTQEKADDETILEREATKETAVLDNIRLETTDETTQENVEVETKLENETTEKAAELDKIIAGHETTQEKAVEETILECEATEEPAELDKILEREVIQEAAELVRIYDDEATEEAATLDKILERDATQKAAELVTIFDEKVIEGTAKFDKILGEPSQVECTSGKLRRIEENVAMPMIAKPKKEVKTANKAINTSFSLIRREDKSTSVVSQSLGSIAKHYQDAKLDLFSSVRVKPKVDYKVNRDSAPYWVTRHYGEPSDSFKAPAPQESQKKGDNDKNIRLWCKDLENGFENLELWNSWIESTTDSLSYIKKKKARVSTDISRNELKREMLQLKHNVDTDVMTWAKQSKNTQDTLKCFRKIYQNLEKQKDNKTYHRMK